MTAVAEIKQRAFAVWWRDMERWVIPSALLLRQKLPLGWTRVRIGKIVKQVTTRIKAQPDIEYKMAGVRWYGEGVFHRETVRGDAMSASQVTPLVAGALIYNRLFAWKASFAVVPQDLADCYVSSEFPQFVPDSARVMPEYLYLFCMREATIQAVASASTGSSAVSRNRFKEEEFLNFEISLPSVVEQKAIVTRWLKAQGDIRTIRWRIQEQQCEIEDCFLRDLGLESPAKAKREQKHFAVTWKMLDRWDVAYFRRPLFNPQSNCYPNVLLSDVVQPLSKTAQRVNPSESPSEDFNYLGMENVEPITGNVKGETIRQGNTIKSTCVVFNKRLVLYGKLRPYLRKVVDCSELAFDQGVASSEFICLRPKEFLVSQAWLAYYLRSAAVAEQAKVAIGARMPRISPNVLLSMCIPLPPLSVQKQIMKRVAAGREEIAREKANAERLSREINAEIEALILGVKRIG